MREACGAGRQAYWVCTLIEESDALQAQAAEATAAELRLALPNLAIGLIHGRLKPKEKESVMAAFKAGEMLHKPALALPVTMGHLIVRPRPLSLGCK